MVVLLMDGATEPSGLSDLEAICRWRRRFDAGEDPGPPPLALPGLARLVRARGFTRHMEKALGLDESASVSPFQCPLAVLLASRPATPTIAVGGSPFAPPILGSCSGRMVSVLRRTSPILAFRAWGISQGRMRGARAAWPVPSVEARCLDSGRQAEADAGDVPHTDATCGPAPCGIYATKTPAAALVALRHDGPVALGVVALAGKVVEHEHGYRAAEATAVAILMVAHGEAMRFDGVEVDELFLAPEAAVAAARLRARRLPDPGPARDAAVVAMLEATMGQFTGGPAAG
jgi:hypothetical protein